MALDQNLVFLMATGCIAVVTLSDLAHSLSEGQLCSALEIPMCPSSNVSFHTSVLSSNSPDFALVSKQLYFIFFLVFQKGSGCSPAIMHPYGVISPRTVASPNSCISFLILVASL